MTLQQAYDRMVERTGKSKFVEGVLGEKPIIKKLSLELLNIDEYYQRYLSKRVFDVAKQFDNELARPLSVFLRPDGKYFVNDGQHTAIMAMLSGGIKEIECTILVHPKNFSEEECRSKEAEHFEALNSSRKNASRIDKIRAGASYGDKDAKEYVEKLKLFGVQVEGLGDDFGYEVKSSSKLEWCWKKNYSDYVISKAINFLIELDKRAWKKGYLNGSIILGVTMIFDLIEKLNGGDKAKGLNNYMLNKFENFALSDWNKGCQGSLGQYLLVAKILQRYNDAVKQKHIPGATIGNTTVKLYGLDLPALQE